MACYRDGGCGPYEMRSCNDCPASRPEYAKRRPAADAAAERDMMPDVLMFIGRFSTDGQGTRREVVECFTQGCCYWFAFILHQRFLACGARIMIDYVANHFGCEIGGRVYDITGDVTEPYTWEPWCECGDAALIQRITEYCIMF